MLTAATQKYIPIIQNFFSSQPVKRAYLFGSCSRGEETPDSDIDLLVSYDYSKKISLFKIGAMIASLQDMLHRPVDLVEEDGLMDFAKQSVEKDKIRIYERIN
jgi:hypothetical protein